MLALAILLLLIVALLVVASFAGSSEELVIEFLNVTINTSVGGVFVAGVVCGLIALASILAARRSWRQSQARAEEVRELRRLAGVPDPDDPAGNTSATGDSAGTSPATVAAEPATANGAEKASNKTGESGTTPSHVASSSTSSEKDTAPLPDPEDPHHT